MPTQTTVVSGGNDRASLPIPEPALTPQEMLKRAEDMRPQLRKRQQATEEAGNMSVEANAELVDAGFFRIVQPRMFGGYEFDLPTYVNVMMEVSRGCPESGWVLALTSGHMFQLATFPIEGLRDVFGDHGEVRAPEVTAPPGKAVPVEGGYRVTGAWDYASGSAHATHIIVVVGVTDDPERRLIMAIVDRDDFTIENNWKVFGMQGTGSDRVIVKDVFVPEMRTKPLFMPTDGQRQLPDRELFGNPLYFGPYRTFVVGESSSVLVGAAEGALDCYEDVFRNKTMFPVGVARSELAEYQFNFGRCRSLIDTAKAALMHTAHQYMDVAQAIYDGEPTDPEAERRMCLVQLEAIELAWQAVAIMFRTAGSSHAHHAAPLGRYWRNISVLRGHLAHQSDTSAINYGRVHFGLPAVGLG